MAGVIAAVADNDIGVAGVAPQAKVLSVKTFYPDGNSNSVLIAEALDYVGDIGVRVANLSSSSPSESLAVREAIASHPNTLYVVAAGNGEAGAARMSATTSTRPRAATAARSTRATTRWST